MAQLRIFTDEDVYSAIAIELRKSGFDAISTPEANRLHAADESQLNWATAEQRAIVTFNVAHFAGLHTGCLQRGTTHAGIIVSSQRPIGDLLRRLLNLVQSLDADAMRDRLEFLSDW